MCAKSICTHGHTHAYIFTYMCVCTIPFPKNRTTNLLSIFLSQEPVEHLRRFYLFVCVCVCVFGLFLFLFFLIYLFIYFWLCWVFAAVRRLSLVAVSRVYSSLQCTGFSLQWLLLFQSTGSRHTGFSSCGSWASVVVARGL